MSREELEAKMLKEDMEGAARSRPSPVAPDCLAALPGAAARQLE